VRRTLKVWLAFVEIDWQEQTAKHLCSRIPTLDLSVGFILMEKCPMAKTPIAAEKSSFAGHKHPDGIVSWIGTLMHLPGFDHEHGDTDGVVVDDAVRDNNVGIATIWLSLGLLCLTTILQLVIYSFANSVALLADAGHNLVDALSSVPLLIAFYLVRRAATRRFTYGFGRAEDIAGIFIVLSILFSAWHIMQESFQRFFHPLSFGKFRVGCACSLDRLCWQ
jgi:hypothetical protein